jgi:hypothetical protein
MSVDKKELPDNSPANPKLTPERQVGEFNSTGQTGIQVDVELQFGTDLKDEKLLQEFISKFQQKQITEEPT